MNKGQLSTSPVKARREHLGLSQQAVATVAKCSLTTVRNAENGWRPSKDMQRSLSKALGVKPEELWPR